MQHVVIVGGGFAGVRLARKLKSVKDLTVTLINNSPDFRYCPALYRAATGYKMGTARLPIEWMLLDAQRFNLVIDTATKIDIKNKKIKTASGLDISYDVAVMALGSVTTYFNIEGLHEHSFGIKTPPEVIELRQHLHTKIANKSESDENYVIVGAGPTGVELAGSLGSYIHHITDKHGISNHRVQIWLVEAAPRILPQLSPRASRAVQKRLQKLGVNVMLDTTVTKETINNLKTASGTIKTNTVIWTAGTANNPFFEQQKGTFKLNQKGRVVVNKHLQAMDSVYVIGDNAATPFSGLALTAIRHANFVAKDIRARLNNHSRPVGYESAPVQIVPAGNKWAVMQYRKLVFHGRLFAMIRKLADYVGYSDVLGYFKALTIWTNRETTEDACNICNKKS